MNHLCSCGNEVVLHIGSTEFSTYCSSCGAESKGPLEEGMKPPTNLSAIEVPSRSQILHAIKNKKEKENKKPRQIRDRTNYVPQRGR